MELIDDLKIFLRDSTDAWIGIWNARIFFDQFDLDQQEFLSYQ